MVNFHAYSKPEEFFCSRVRCQKLENKPKLKFELLNDEHGKVCEKIWICEHCKSKFKDKEDKPFFPKPRKKYDKKYVILTERDSCIEEFLDRVGWGDYEQIETYLELKNFTQSRTSLVVRLSRLVKFGRLRSTRSIESTYFALSKESKRTNELVNVLRHDRLPHENFLVNLALSLGENCLTKLKFPREIRSEIILGEKSGPIPDLIILDDDGNDFCHVEYERTAKSKNDIRASIYNWLRSPRRNKNNAYIVVVCENNVIHDKYVNIISEMQIDSFREKFLFCENPKSWGFFINFYEYIEAKDGKGRSFETKMGIRILTKELFNEHKMKFLFDEIVETNV